MADPAFEAAGIVWDAEEELSVNPLRQLMLEELRRRNFADTTVRTYLHGVAHFSQYFHRPPDQLGPEEIRKYQAALFTQLKYSPNTVILRLAALRFFYIHVLKRGWSIAETPYPKKVRHLPVVLSQEEVARLIEAADTPFHRILLMTMYATGARRAEAAHLKVSDIDSQRMVVHSEASACKPAIQFSQILEETRRVQRSHFHICLHRAVLDPIHLSQDRHDSDRQPVASLTFFFGGVHVSPMGNAVAQMKQFGLEILLCRICPRRQETAMFLLQQHW